MKQCFDVIRTYQYLPLLTLKAMEPIKIALGRPLSYQHIILNFVSYGFINSLMNSL